MKTTITTKSMELSQGIIERINKKTATMDRYLRQETEIIVHLRKTRNMRVCEITVPLNGTTLRAESQNPDNLFMSIDSALAKIERQILKHRTKLEKRLRDDAYADKQGDFIEDSSVYDDPRQVVRYKNFPVRPMSVEDATLEMELLGHAFFAFVNIDTERTNVLYLRKDGNLGLLEPET